MSLSFGDVTREGYGYSSILRAIERLILMRSSTLPNRYAPNFEGITRALWDLGSVLEGDIPPPATSSMGQAPPNWDLMSGDYLPGGTPADGSFWFDERQGRLFISKDGEWHQVNGAESIVHLGTSPPARETPGLLWFDTRQGVGLVYVDEVTGAGEPGWFQLNGGGSPIDGAGGIVYTQATPAEVWTINHNLGRRPSVELLDSGGSEIDGDVVHPSINQTVITLSPATAGIARLI